MGSPLSEDHGWLVSWVKPGLEVRCPDCKVRTISTLPSLHPASNKKCVEPLPRDRHAASPQAMLSLS